MCEGDGGGGGCGGKEHAIREVLLAVWDNVARCWYVRLLVVVVLSFLLE